MTKEKAKGIQTALWAALVLVQMSVVGALEVRAETVRREVTYEAVEGEAALPDEITVSVLAGNDEELVRCRAVEQVEEDAYWRDDFSFPITFYEYGAGEYQLGEIIVGGAELTDFTQPTKLAQQYGTELLRSMGLSEEEYEVEEIVWAGTPYENEDSIVCRDAVARGNRLLRDYQVVYEGVVEPERWKELKRGGAPGELDEAQMQEEPAWEEAEETAGAKVETEAARPEEAEKQPEVKKSGLQEFLEKVTRILLIAVGIGAIFFFGGLLVLALLWIYRKLREWHARRR